jgi:predicted ABC-type ATPase
LYGNPYFYNGDIVFAEKEKQYPAWNAAQLSGAVAVDLERTVDSAIKARKDFVFESNFSNDMAVHLTNTFKASGYKTRLVFFGIENLETCVSRVMQRSYTGGHHVSLDVIKFNHEEGIKRVNANLSLFENIVFIDNSKEKNKSVIVALYSQATNYKIIEEQDCSWFQTHFRASFDML